MAKNIRDLTLSLDYLTLQNKEQQLVQRFYEILFEKDDGRIHALFQNTKMQEQHNKFVLSLVLVVENIAARGQYDDLIEKLGINHLQQYGVTLDMIPLFKASLMEALQEILDSQWDDDLYKAWDQALDSAFETLFGYLPR